MIKTLKKVLLAVFCLGFLAGIGLFVFGRLFSGMCGNEIYQEVLSPDGNFNAVLFQRDCGATTSFSTQISLISQDRKLPNESGNIFIINRHPKDIGIELLWAGPSELLIKHTDGLEYSKKETEYQEITISY